MSEIDRIVSIDGKMYDIKTSNRAFLDAALFARDIGVKNWYAPLEIIDTTLCDIDLTKVNPETGEPALSTDDMVRVLTECKRNPWYYFREVLKLSISDQSCIMYLAPLCRGLKNLG